MTPLGKPGVQNFLHITSYGPLTNLRRGEAMRKRKEVMEEKLYRNAYVKFPAVRMGRKDGEDSYSEVANYSNKCVSKLAVFVHK